MSRKVKIILKELGIFCFAITLASLIAANQGLASPLERTQVSNDLPNVDILLSVIKNNDGGISHIGVVLEVSQLKSQSEKLFTLKAPVVFSGIEGIADRIKDMKMKDEEGIVELKKIEDSADAGGFIFWRKWQAKRPASGMVRVKYICSLPEPVPRLGPPFDLRINGGGVSGAGYGFLALPDIIGSCHMHLDWDIKNMDPDSKGVSSLGEGEIECVGPMEQVFSSYFMVGAMGRFPQKGKVNGFSSYWLGDPPFDAEELMSWSAESYAALKSFFQDTSSDPYRFFMRIGPDNNGVGGAGLYNSFMLFVPVEPELTQGIRGTIAHEMTHHWVGHIEGPPGSTFWFSEGVVVHYTRLLMFRAGLFSIEEFLEDANSTVIRYLTNPLKNLHNDEIEELFWSDRNAQVVPYDRGSLYFAHIDAKIREASSDKRSVDDLLLSMFERRNNGETMTKEMFLELLEEELGPSAVKEFESIIIQGEDFVPHSDAFGPCFKRIPTKIHVFELGFDERKTLYSSEKKVTGLKSGSAAEQAGLQNGDLILNKINLKALRRDENLTLKLKVKRGDKVLEIEYLPRDGYVDGYKWVRDPEVPEEKCRDF